MEGAPPLIVVTICSGMESQHTRRDDRSECNLPRSPQHGRHAESLEFRLQAVPDRLKPELRAPSVAHPADPSVSTSRRKFLRTVSAAFGSALFGSSSGHAGVDPESEPWFKTRGVV